MATETGSELSPPRLLDRKLYLPDVRALSDLEIDMALAELDGFKDVHFVRRPPPAPGEPSPGPTDGYLTSGVFGTRGGMLNERAPRYCSDLVAIVQLTRHLCDDQHRVPREKQLRFEHNIRRVLLDVVPLNDFSVANAGARHRAEALLLSFAGGGTC
jgi:hypothetical protein